MCACIHIIVYLYIKNIYTYIGSFPGYLLSVYFINIRCFYVSYAREKKFQTTEGENKMMKNLS